MNVADSALRNLTSARQQTAPLERAHGTVRLSVESDRGETCLHRLFQQGSLKVRFPRRADHSCLHSVLMNTAGGITGGDCFETAVAAGRGALVTLSSQSAEKVYRTLAGAAYVGLEACLAAHAGLQWLPQETILFDGAALQRRINVDMAADAELLLCEAVILGRAARGETVRSGLLQERWQVRRAGKLVYADALALKGDIAGTGDRAATLGGATAFASLLFVSPRSEEQLERVRAALAAHGQAGATAWNGMLAVRIVATHGMALRRAIVAALSALDVPIPHVWTL